MIIYKALNKINGKTYIGQTNNLNKRIYEHIWWNRLLFDRALNKYGLQSFEISVIDSCLLKEIANEKEKYWISFYNCKYPNGYNLTDGGEGMRGHKHTEESKHKMSKTMKGHLVSEETRKKLSLINKGRKHSKETKQKMSKSHKGENHHMFGKHPSKETLKKSSESHRGKHLSEENRRKISESLKKTLNLRKLSKEK